MNELYRQHLAEKIALLPDKPGSYQMKDGDGLIIYVGKAKSLKKRVSQYFLRPQEGKVKRMVLEIRDFDIIETTSEKEALLLEISLIHKLHPKYNIMLMDDRSYPYIALKKKGYPYLKTTRNDKDKNYTYYGPFPNSSQAYKTIAILNKIYPLRKCKTIPKKPCLYYHMQQCLAPCVFKLSEESEDEIRKKTDSFLKGETSELSRELREKMRDASARLDFERAKEYKDILVAIKDTTENQKIIFPDHKDRDVIGFSTREGYICIYFLIYKKGVLLGKKNYVVEAEDNVLDVLENVIFQFYQTNAIPQEIIIPNLEMIDLLSSSLSTRVISPIRGAKRDLITMAIENAKQSLDEHFQTSRLEDDVLVLLEELKAKLNLKKTPLDIELYDNSHLMGSEPVASMVKFINGKRAKNEYRKYKITQANPQDDLASMEEILTRRFIRLKEENAKLPDLILLDGGLNQCEVALRVEGETGVEIPLAGLEKNDRHETDSLINPYTGEVIPLEKKSPLFFLLMRMQDEVHRFAITYHKSKREKDRFKTIYDDIKGIGEKRKEKLLSLYPTLDSLKGVKSEELSQIVPFDIANAILKKRDELEKK